MASTALYGRQQTYSTDVSKNSCLFFFYKAAVGNDRAGTAKRRLQWLHATLLPSLQIGTTALQDRIREEG